MLEELIDAVVHRLPMQRKSILDFVRSHDDEYRCFAEELSDKVYAICDGFEYAVESYADVCSSILAEQVRYNKAGTYRFSTSEMAEREVYSQESMREYAIGLLLTYVLWPNHYQMWKFFRDHLSQIRPSSVLEIGAGHGLFSSEVSIQFPFSDIEVVDISRESIALSSEMVSYLSGRNAKFTQANFLTWNPNKSYDFIIMGEVIEHTDRVPEFLAKARECLKPGGAMYLSTCANCPAIDHVWHFTSLNDIRSEMTKAGFAITDELGLRVPSFPETINYCGILTR